MTKVGTYKSIERAPPAMSIKNTQSILLDDTYGRDKKQSALYDDMNIPWVMTRMNIQNKSHLTLLLDIRKMSTSKSETKIRSAP